MRKKNRLILILPHFSANWIWSNSDSSWPRKKSNPCSEKACRIWSNSFSVTWRRSTPLTSAPQPCRVLIISEDTVEVPFEFVTYSKLRDNIDQLKSIGLVRAFPAESVPYFTNERRHKTWIHRTPWSTLIGHFQLRLWWAALTVIAGNYSGLYHRTPSCLPKWW